MTIKTLPVLRTRYSAILVGFLMMVCSFVSIACMPQRQAIAAANQTINFQARLMASSGAVVPDGTYNVEFKLYNALSSSGSSQGSCTGDAACLWTETRTSANKVQVINGYLTVELGSITALPSIDWSQNLYLTMNIGGTGSAVWDGEMTPRLHLTAVPHALTADKLTKTNGSFLSTLDFVQPTATRSILLPDESGTVCIQNSTNCGFALASGNTNYIQNNQTGTPQSANIFIQNAGANSASTATIKMGSAQTGAGLLVTDSSNNPIWQVKAGVVSQNVGLRISVSSTTADTFTTPVGSSVKTAINIPLYNPGAAGQLLAFGLPNSADDTSRAISVFDNRSNGVIQPAIALFSPNENDVFGLSWNGLNTTASLETLSGAIALRPGGTNVKLWAGSTGVAIGSNVSSASYPLDVTGDVNTSTQYRIGGTVICTSSGCTPTAGSGNYIQNGTSLQSGANFNISGTGTAGTSLQAPLLDTATAVALNIGTTNATAINLNKNTVITGNISQSTGTISLAGNAASSITTSTGALTLTAAGSSNWTVGGTNQSLTITTSGTGTLILGTTGAGTVTMGSSSATINIATTNNAHTVHIADGGTSTTQAVTIGSANGSSSTTIQGGTGSTAIALTTATNGTIVLTAPGSGGVSAQIGSTGFVIKTTTNSNTALQVVDSSNQSIFNVNTATGTIVMGALVANYSSFDGTLSAPFGTMTLGGTNATFIQGSSASTIKATSGSFATTISFTAPTANRSIVIPDEGGTVCMRNSTNCGFATSSGSANYIQNTTTVQSANFYVQAATSGTVAGVLQANAAGTGDILQLKNGAGTSVATFGYAGAILFKNSTNSVTAFDVQNAAGASVLTADTTNKRVGIGNNAPTVDLDVGPSTLGVGQIVQVRIGDFLIQSQQGGANGLAALTSRGSNGNLTLDGASGSAVYLAPFTTNNVYLASGGGKVAVGNSAPALKFEVQGGDAAIYNNGNNARVVLGDNATTGQYGWLQWDSANDYFRIETAGSNGLKVKDNNVSIGNIYPGQPLTVGSGTTQLFQVTSTGASTFTTSTNSTTAFQVQNASSAAAFNVDTTNLRVGIGGITAPAVSLDVSGAIQQTGLMTSDTQGTDANKWTQMGTCTITAQYQQCLTNLFIIGGHDGTAGDNSYAKVTVRVKQQNALGGAPYVNLVFGNESSVITKNDIMAVTTTNNGTTTVVQLWGRITNTFEHWFFTPVLNTGNSGAATWTWSQSAGFSAALPGGTQTAATYATTFADTMTLQNAANSTTAFQVKNAAGNNVFAVDTTNSRLSIGGAFNPQETVDVVGNLQVRDATTATKSYRLRTSGGGLDFEGAGANLVLSVWSGAGYTGTQYNQITFKSDGSNMDFARGFNVSSGTAKVGLGGNINPQYALDITGDVNVSGNVRVGGTIMCDSTGCTAKTGSGFYIHNQTGVQTTANFNIDGTGTLGTSVLAPLLDTATAVALNIGTTNATAINLNKSTTITGGLTQSGGIIDLSGNAASTIKTTSGGLTLQAFNTNTLTLTTTGAGTIVIGGGSTTTINLGRGADVARTYNLGYLSSGTTSQTINLGYTSTGSVTNIYGGTSSSAINLTPASGGNINLTTASTGNITITPGSSGVFIKPAANSTAAFQVSAFSSNNSVLRVDTTNERVAIGVISDPIGAKLSVATSSAVTIRGYQGSTFDAFQLGNNTADFLTVSSTGNFLLKPSTNSTSAFAIQMSDATPVMAVDTSNNKILFGDSWSTHHVGIDLSGNNGVLEVGATGGNLALGLKQISNGNAQIYHSSDLVVQRSSGTSATDFQIQNASNTALFTVDTAGNNIQIGSATTDATATLLTLDSYNNATDPSGTNGAMYYNTAVGKFRCYESSAWKDCLSRHITTLGSDVANSTTSLADATGLSFSATSGTTYRFHAQIIYSAAASSTGSVWSMNAPATTLLGFTCQYALTTATSTITYSSVVNTPTTANVSSANSAGNMAIIDGILTPSANGTVIVRFASEVAASAITAKAGSTIEWW